MKSNEKKISIDLKFDNEATMNVALNDLRDEFACGFREKTRQGEGWSYKALFYEEGFENEIHYLVRKEIREEDIDGVRCLIIPSKINFEEPI